MTKFDLTWEKTWRNRTHPEDDRPFLNMNREVSLQCQDTSLQKVDVTNDVNKSFIIQMFSKVMLQPCPYHDGFKKWFFNVKFVLKENCRKFILGVTKYLKKVSWRQVTFGYKKKLSYQFYWKTNFSDGFWVPWYENSNLLEAVRHIRITNYAK